MNTHRLRRRPARRLAVAALVAASAVGGPIAAHADDRDRLLELSEHGGDTVVEVHFDDVVPGDSEEFTIDVRNAGPSPGVLVVDLPRPGLSGDASRQFFRDLKISGPHLEPTSVDGLGPRTLLLAERITPGQQVSVPLRFDYPFDLVERQGGNEALDGEHVVDIDLRAQIVGEDEAPDPGAEVSKHGAHAETGGVAWTPRTGADLGLLALAAALTGGGLTLWVLATRRKEQQEEQ